MKIIVIETINGKIGTFTEDFLEDIKNLPLRKYYLVDFSKNIRKPDVLEVNLITKKKVLLPKLSFPTIDLGNLDKSIENLVFTSIKTKLNLKGYDIPETALRKLIQSFRKKYQKIEDLQRAILEKVESPPILKIEDALRLARKELKKIKNFKKLEDYYNEKIREINNILND